MALRFVNFLTNVTRQAVNTICQPKAYSSFQAVKRARSLTHVPLKTEYSDKLQYDKRQPRFYSQPPVYRTPSRQTRSASDFKGKDEIDYDDEEYDYDNSFEKKVLLDDFQYELESTRPRDLVKEGDGVFDVYNHYTQMYKDRNTKILPHLQPNNLKPYGSTDTLTSPPTVSRPKITYPIYDTFDSSNPPYKSDKDDDMHRREYSTMKVNSTHTMNTLNETDNVQRRRFSTGEADSPPRQRKEMPGYCPMNKTPKLVTKRRNPEKKAKSSCSLAKSEELQVSEDLIEKHKKLRSKYKAKQEEAESEPIELKEAEENTEEAVQNTQSKHQKYSFNSEKYKMRYNAHNNENFTQRNNYKFLNKLSQFSYRSKEEPELEPELNVSRDNTNVIDNEQPQNEAENSETPLLDEIAPPKKQTINIKSVRMQMPISILQSGAFPGEMPVDSFVDLQPNVKLAVPWPSYSETLVIKKRSPSKCIVYPGTMPQCDPITATNEVPQRSLSTMNLNDQKTKKPMLFTNRGITTENTFRLDAGMYSPDCRLRNVFNKKFFVKSNEKQASSPTHHHSPVLNSSQRTFATKGKKCPPEPEPSDPVCNVSIKKVQSRCKDLPKLKLSNCPCPRDPHYSPAAKLKRPKKIRKVKSPKRKCGDLDPCEDRVRADDNLVVCPKDLPCYIPKDDCNVILPQYKDVAPLKRPVFKQIDEPPKPKKAEKCDVPRSDRTIKVFPKDLPVLPLSDCPCPRDPEYAATPALKMPKKKHVITQVRKCPRPETCEEKAAYRADMCLKVEKKELPPYIPQNCPCNDPTPPTPAPQLRRLQFKHIEQVRPCYRKEVKCDPALRSDINDWQYVYADACSEKSSKIGKKVNVEVKCGVEKDDMKKIMNKKNKRRYSTASQPLNCSSNVSILKPQWRSFMNITQHNRYSTTSYSNEYSMFYVKNGISATHIIKSTDDYSNMKSDSNNLLDFTKCSSRFNNENHQHKSKSEISNSAELKDVKEYGVQKFSTNKPISLETSKKNKYYSAEIGKHIDMNENKMFVNEDFDTLTKCITNDNNSNQDRKNKLEGPHTEYLDKFTVGTYTRINSFSSILHSVPQSNKYGQIYANEEKEFLIKRSISTEVLSKIYKGFESNKKGCPSYYPFSDGKMKQNPAQLDDLQPKKKFINDKDKFVLPPPYQDKIDPMLEDRCIREKLGIPRSTTWTCENFHTKKFKPLRVKDFQVELAQFDENQEQGFSCIPEQSCMANNMKCKATNKSECSSEGSPAKLIDSCHQELEQNKCIERPLSLWERIVNYFKARPDCPPPAEFRRQYLKKDAERAAARAGLCVYDPLDASEKNELPKIITAKDCPSKKCEIPTIISASNKSQLNNKTTCSPFGYSKSGKKLYSTLQKSSVEFLKKFIDNNGKSPSKSAKTMYDIPIRNHLKKKVSCNNEQRRNYSSWRYIEDPFNVFGSTSLNHKSKGSVIKKLLNSSEDNNLRHNNNMKDFSKSKISNIYLNDIANELPEYIDEDEKLTYSCVFRRNTNAEQVYGDAFENNYEVTDNLENLIENYLEAQGSTDCDYEHSEKIKTENMVKFLEELLEEEPPGARKNH